MNDINYEEEVAKSLKTTLQTTTSNDNPVTNELIEKVYPAALLAVSTVHNQDIETIEAQVDKAKICNWVETQFNIYQGDSDILKSDEDHETWLYKRREAIEWHHWNAYRALLDQRMPPVTVKKLHQVTDDILDLMNDPLSPGQWDTRGLVMGHVQSGKTANYVGLITKAADAGYRIIIVLAGLHNSLRSQTQMRIDEGFIGRDTRQGVLSALPYGVGTMKTHGISNVLSFTSAEANGDFRRAVAQRVTGNIYGEIPHIFVVKKNVSPLKNLREWIKAIANLPEGQEKIRNVPLLIIDDEADQASVDTKGGTDPEDEEHDPAAINKRIRLLLNDFEQSAYVGYTATPFANVFQPVLDEPQHEYGLDLFPKSFIISLDAPSNYVGPAKLFGFTQQGDTSDTEGLPLTRIIQDATYSDWLPDKHKKTHIPDEHYFPDSLETAIDMFVLSCAARLIREKSGKHHNSMLIHVTRFVAVQEIISEQVRSYLDELRVSLRNDNRREATVKQRLKKLWEKEYIPKSQQIMELDEDFGAEIHTFTDIEEKLLEASSRIEVLQVSGNSKEALDYQLDGGIGRSFIAVGGDKLSRGLTLEGLSISYYNRPSRMYDTLMQMGRWFGYRPRYLDLCRIWTTSTIKIWYRDIALATHELIGEFKEMSQQGLTPKQFGLRVRSHPDMMITNRAKLRGGEKKQVTFSNHRPELTSFDTAETSKQKSFEIMESFLNELPIEPDAEKISDLLFRGVNHDSVVEYFRALHENNLNEESKYPPGTLADYIERTASDGGLTDWTVCLKSTGKSKSRRIIRDKSIGTGMRSDRSGEDRPMRQKYVTKSIIGSADESIDLDQNELETARKRAEILGRTNPNGTDFRFARPPERGLLIFSTINDDHGIEIDELPYVSYCMSFPDDGITGGRQVSYYVNSVWQKYE